MVNRTACRLCRTDRPEARSAPARVRGRRGSALIEFTIVSTFLFVTLFGIIEFGMIFRSKLSLVNAARNGARQAAVGGMLATIRGVTRNTANMTVTDGQIYCEYNDALDGTGSWVTCADNGGGTANNCPVGYLLRVRIQSYAHTMITGSFFSWVSGVSGSQMNLNAAVVMRRE